MERRSANRTAPRKRYTVDAFEGIEELQDARSGNEDSDIEIDVDADDSAEEFAANASPSGRSAPSSSDEAMSGADDEVASNNPSDAGDRNLDDTISIAESEPEITRRTSTKKSQRKARLSKSYQGPAPAPGKETYTRGLQDGIHATSSHDVKRRSLFGGGREDADPAYSARAKWVDEPTLPSRRADGRSVGGMRQSFYVKEGVMRKRKHEEGEAWRAQGGPDACFKRQRLDDLDKEAGRAYLPAKEGGEVSFLMGPYNAPNLYQLGVGDSMPLIEAWSDDRPRPKKRPPNYKQGFMINAGARVQLLEWAPHQHGQHQYLAVAVLDSSQAEHAPFEAPDAPSFTPQPPHFASIQIWQVEKQEDGTIDVDTGCKLAFVFCTDWGEIRNIKFCPMSIDRPEPFNNNIDLGLLAGIWSDGTLRVLRLNSLSQSDNTSFIHASQVAFSSRPPSTLCSCIAWLSSTRIAAGCANGFLAIWDLPPATTSTESNARPSIYTHLSNSYILSIASCYPSRPDFLLTTSMAGYTLITDLSHPGQSLGSAASTVHGARARIAQPGLAWHDYLQTIVHAEDNIMVKGSPLRRVFAGIGLARAEGTVTSLAVSPCHPFMLVGSASGEVTAVNPVARVLGMRGMSWQQTWFAHEWRRPTAEEAEHAAGPDESEATEDTQSDATGQVERPVIVGANGVSRITEGFKIERNVLAKEDAISNAQKGMLAMTIYEEKSAVSALSWNPNVEVGGWAAAGMGDGLIRIEDIAT